jgi:hypothetical protein
MRPALQHSVASRCGGLRTGRVAQIGLMPDEQELVDFEALRAEVAVADAFRLRFLDNIASD